MNGYDTFKLMNLKPETELIYINFVINIEFINLLKQQIQLTYTDPLRMFAYKFHDT